MNNKEKTMFDIEGPFTTDHQRARARMLDRICWAIACGALSYLLFAPTPAPW
jgi:hypothetical protein